MARSPFRVLKFLARIAVILVCANILIQLWRTGSIDFMISSYHQPMLKSEKRDGVGKVFASALVAKPQFASSLIAAAAGRVSPPARPPGQAAAAMSVALAKKANDRIGVAWAAAEQPRRPEAAIAKSAAGMEYVERSHTVCWSPSATLSSIGGDRSASCRTASKRVRIPKWLADVIESSGRRAAASLADVDIERSLVFVTGASANHFVESLALIQNLQLHHRGRKIVYWDLGLTEDQAANVSALCGVTYRKFNFTRLPAHAASLVTYAFKPLCILRTFEEHSAIWWVDASVRFRSGGNLGLAAAMARDRRGLLTFLGTGHYVFEATHKQMFDYLATDQERLKSTRCVMATSFVVVNTRDLFERLLRWYYWCALDERCIAPVQRPTACQFSADHRSYANCHRFDQCVLNILSANMWQFNAAKMATRELNFTVHRGARIDSLPKYCQRT